MTSPHDSSQDAEQRMLGAVPGVPALGRGPAADGDYSRHEYHQLATANRERYSPLRARVRFGRLGCRTIAPEMT